MCHKTKPNQTKLMTSQNLKQNVTNWTLSFLVFFSRFFLEVNIIHKMQHQILSLHWWWFYIKNNGETFNIRK